MSKTKEELELELAAVRRAILNSYEASSLSMEGRSLTKQRLDILVEREASLEAQLEEKETGIDYKVREIL